MPATQYKIWAIGSPVGGGVTNTVHVGVSGVAKGNEPQFPNNVINELICNLLARAILLPIPPGFLINNSGKPFFVSLNFNLAGHGLPPADESEIVHAHPDLSCGIILFDSWILNPDRHNRNIAFDKTSNQIQIFDHSHSLYSIHTDIKTFFSGVVNDAYLGGHCLTKEVELLDGMKRWYERINSVPEFYIREVVKSTESIGFDKSLTDFCSDFLLDRRKRLLDFFKNNHSLLPKVQTNEWNKLN